MAYTLTLTEYSESTEMQTLYTFQKLIMYVCMYMYVLYSVNTHIGYQNGTSNFQFYIVIECAINFFSLYIKLFLIVQTTLSAVGQPCKELLAHESGSFCGMLKQEMGVHEGDSKTWENPDKSVELATLGELWGNGWT